MDFAQLKTELTRDEGNSPTVYIDSLGNASFGIGHNGKKPLSQRAISVIYEDDSNDAILDLDRVLPWWRSLSERRQRVLVNMCFNMGIGGLLEFKNALAAMQAQDWKTAAAEILDSEWSKQVGDRAQRLATMMENG